MNYFYVVLFLIITMNISAEQPQKLLQQLIDGNRRYLSDQLKHPNRTSESRKAVVQRQEPFAVILSCADSRVAPEIIFDQGIGDLFVVRVAGNVAGLLELESIQYAIENLGSRIVLVLGHENCGAVSAVVDGTTKDIQAIAQLIEPAIKKVKKGSDHFLGRVIQANVEQVVSQLKKTSFLDPLLSQNKVIVIGGIYHLKTGKVDFLQ